MIVVAVAVMVAAVPTYRMLGCEMPMVNGMMPGWAHAGTWLGEACDGHWVASTAPDGVVQGPSSGALIGLIAAIAAAGILFSPHSELRPVRVVGAHGPPPPLEPRGERFLI